VSTLLITGASGNIGTALLRRLQAERPDVAVIAVARRTPPPQAPYDGARWHSIDLTEPAQADKLVDIMRGVTTVVHLAWGFQPTRDPDYLRRLDVEGTARVLAAADGAGVAQLIHMSSVGTYGPRRNNQPVTEDYPHTGMPTSNYSRHKAAAEALLDDY
jgi:nucleoside-diphosphate-sugar epimerase